MKQKVDEINLALLPLLIFGFDLRRGDNHFGHPRQCRYQGTLEPENGRGSLSYSTMIGDNKRRKTSVNKRMPPIRV